MHCLPGSENLASSYVDVKNRQQVSDGLTAEKRDVTIAVVLKRIILEESGSPDSLIGSRP